MNFCPENRSIETIVSLQSSDTYSIGKTGEKIGLEKTSDNDERNKGQHQQRQRPSVDEGQDDANAQIRHVLQHRSDSNASGLNTSLETPEQVESDREIYPLNVGGFRR